MHYHYYGDDLQETICKKDSTQKSSGLKSRSPADLSLDGNGDVAAGDGVVVDDGGQLDVLLLLGGGLVVAPVQDQLDQAEDSTEAIGYLHVLYVKLDLCMQLF